ncbi:MAG TPA: DoxX family protein [Thermoanaerobaculia bacterium]|nr:DoxX family protein [Thermoanaerobaculia bacterium]
MNGSNAFATRWSPRMLAVLRIVTALLFMQHGTQKLLGFPGGSEGGGPPLMSLIGLAGILELVGGLLIVIGLLTRPVAFILSGEMAVAYFMVHAPQGPWPLLNQGELPALYCFIFLYLAVAGGGVWSLDDAIARKRRKPAM